jgi:glycerophosphoryl diester phosphodiesterase
MRGISCVAILVAALAGFVTPGQAEGTRVEQILERFEHANLWRDHVMIVAHRGGWMGPRDVAYHPGHHRPGSAAASDRRGRT